jgi:hypothetical protein
MNGKSLNASQLRGVTLVLILASLVAACDDNPAGPNAGGTPVTLSIAIGAGPGAAPGLFAAGLELDDGVNTLVIESAEMVLKEIEFEHVSTSGCDSGVSDDDCEEFETGPYLVDLPLDGSVTREIGATVPPGTFDEIEFEIHSPDDDTPEDLDFRSRNPAFAQISIRVTGTYNDAAFEYTTEMDSEQEIDLASPLVVTPESGPVNVTLTVDISTWFVAPGGTLVDPSTANKDQPNQELVENNIEASIEGFRDDDGDGVPHDDDDDEEDDDDDS